MSRIFLFLIVVAMVAMAGKSHPSKHEHEEETDEDTRYPSESSVVSSPCRASTQMFSVAGVVIGSSFIETEKVAASTQTRKEVASSTRLIEGTSTAYTARRVIRTVYTNQAGIVVAVQVTFENVNDSEMRSVLKGLDEKYSRERQTQNDKYVFFLGPGLMLESIVTPIGVRKGAGRNAHTKYRIVNFYADTAAYKQASATNPSIEKKNLL